MMKWYHFREGGKVPAAKPNVQTGIPQGGYARPAWNTYLEGTNPYDRIDFSKYAGTKVIPRSMSTYTPKTFTPTEVPEIPVDTSGGGSTTVPVSTPIIETSNPYPGSEIPSSVPQVDTLFDIPVPFQEATRVGIQEDEHGFTTEDVLAAREQLDAGETLEGFVAPPPVAAPGSDQTTQHAVVDSAFNTYGDALSAVPNDGSATTEQRIAAAAANPGFNPEVANTYADKNVQVGTVPFTGDNVGLTKRAENILTGDTERVLNQSIDRGESNEQRGANQNALAAATALSAGVTGIGGKFNQSGDNAGLPSDYLIVGSSDGSQEVWGPDGKTYSSVEEAKADVPDAKKDATAEKLSALTDAAKSGRVSAADINRATYKDKDISSGDRAKLMAQAQASQGDSAADKRKAAEARAAEQAAADKIYAEVGEGFNAKDLSPDEAKAKYAELTGKNVDKKEAASALNNLYSKGQDKAHQAIADPVEKAKATGDSGDLKSAIYELRKQGASSSGSLRGKSTSQLKAILANAESEVNAPPPVAPPPQPVAQAVQQPAVIPPQPVAQVTPAPVVQAPAPTPVVTPPPAVLPTAPVADPFDWANNPNNPANAGKVIPVSEWGDQTPTKGK